MGIVRELKVRARQIAGPVIGMTVVVYFAYHVVQGDRGLLALGTFRGEVETLQARTAVNKKGWRFLGADRCRKLSPYKRARSFEPLRSRNPTFAVGRGQRAAFFEAVKELRAFRAAYRHARDLWRKGQRTVQFPFGTWWMHRFHGAPCVGPPCAPA